MEAKKISDLWWWLIDNGIATMNELKLITGIIGYNTDTLNKVLFYRTGYRDREQLESELQEGEKQQNSKLALAPKTSHQELVLYNN